MVVEVVLLFVMTGFVFGGLVGPVTVWAIWTHLRRQRLIAELREGGIARIDEPGEEDAERPVRLVLHVGDRPVFLEAVTRGDVPLWHLRVALDPGSVGPREFALMRRGWGRDLPEARELPLVEEDAGTLPPALVLRAADASVLRADRPERFKRALALVGGAGEPLLQCVVRSSELLVEVVRENLDATVVNEWVRQALELARELGGIEPVPRLQPARVSTSAAVSRGLDVSR
jgi:hypothetical protein